MAFNISSTRPCSFLTYNPNEVKYGRGLYQTACVVAILLIIPSTILNLLLLKSMHSSMALRKPSTLLLYNLSLSDLLIAVVQLPIYIVKKIGQLDYDYELYCATATYAYVVGFMLSTTSLFTVTAISIDRYLIIHKGVHYPEQVTTVRSWFYLGFCYSPKRLTVYRAKEGNI
jgi:hypothetical protein